MYKVDIENKDLTKLSQTTFKNEKLKERYDIQEWIEKNPEIIEENLLIIDIASYKYHFLENNKTKLRG